MDRQYFRKRLADLKWQRRSWETTWKDLRDYMLPEAGIFDLSPSDDKDSSGDNKQANILDPTGIRSLHILASGLRTGLTSPSRDWFRLVTDDSDLNSFWTVKQWFEEVEKRIRSVLNKSNFYEVQFQSYKEIGCFGICSYAIMEDYKTIARFIPFTIGEYSIGTDMYNRVNALYREYALTVNQVVEMFGYNKVSQRVKASYDNNRKEEWINIVSAIEPNVWKQNGKMDYTGMDYISVHWERDADDNSGFLKVSGFREFPVVCPRWTINGNNIYGYSPARDARGAVKGLQKLVHRSLEAIDKLTNPPMVAPSSLRKTGGNILPGGVTYIDQDDGQFIPAYQINIDIKALEMKIEQTRNEVKQAMFNDLFMMIAQTDKNMTATEVMERQQEKLVMLSPVVERLQTEMLDPVLNRIFMILLRGGMLPTVPEELRNADIKAKYISVLAQTQEYLGDIKGIHQLVGFAGNMMSVYPEVRDKINPDEVINLYGEGLGISPKIIRSNEEAGFIRGERAKQAASAQQMEGMEKAANSAKLLSEAKIDEQNALEKIIGNVER